MTEVITEQIVLGLGAALGIGLLIGVERERRMGQKGVRTSAGLRTFAITGLLGALSLLLGGELALVSVAVVVGLLAIAGYLRAQTRDTGMTSEVALMTTFLLGALAMRNPALAGGLGVLTTILLASRTRLHRFVRQIITEQEVHDGLLLGAAALVILPLMPDRVMGPLEVFNPRTLWTLAVLVMAINAAGYVALRWAGPRYGLSLAGFSSGFVSSSATIAAMGERARQHPELRLGAIAGAVLSSVATVVQLGAILAAVSREVLVAMTLPLLAAGLVSIVYGAVYAYRSARMGTDQPVTPGRAFDPRFALLFALAITGVLMLAALAMDMLGPRGLALTTALTGFADAHSTAAAAAAMAAGGKLRAVEAIVPILAGFTTNSVTKIVLAVISGDRAFARQVIPGVVLMVAAAWLGALPQLL